MALAWLEVGNSWCTVFHTWLTCKEAGNRFEATALYSCILFLQIRNAPLIKCSIMCRCAVVLCFILRLDRTVEINLAFLSYSLSSSICVNSSVYTGISLIMHECHTSESFCLKWDNKGVGLSQIFIEKLIQNGIHEIWEKPSFSSRASGLTDTRDLVQSLWLKISNSRFHLIYCIIYLFFVRSPEPFYFVARFPLVRQLGTEPCLGRLKSQPQLHNELEKIRKKTTVSMFPTRS